MTSHDFTLLDGIYWCITEDVNSDDCTDYGRCNHECVCNYPWILNVEEIENG